MSTSFAFKPIVTDGLILNLDAANRKSFVSGSTSWYDLSGGRNTGTLNGPTGGLPSYSSANGGYISFDGTDDYVDCGNNSIINTAVNTCTINVWFKQTTSASYKFLTSKGPSDANENFVLTVGYTNSKLYFDVGGGGPYVDITYSYSLNTWYNICATHNRVGGSSTLLIYINGILIPGTVASPTLTPITNSSNFTIGSGRGNTLNFPGNIANVSLYNRALSATEVLQNYNALKNRYI